MAPLEPWQKVLVSEEFADDPHGNFQCTLCHGGVSNPDMDTAHTGMVADPSEPGKGNACATCHGELKEHFDASLHASQSGYWERLGDRSLPENHDQLAGMFDNHCSSCHTTCGDCHISQPAGVGGGFVDGHVVNKTPSMSQNCTACHGSRVGNEYLGKHEGIPGDVHFRSERMNCMSCHTGTEMHDSTASCEKCHKTDELAAMDTGNSRYDGEQVPSCESCHPEVGADSDPNMQHSLHKDTLQCQVCHSVQNTSCDSCHVQVSEKTGNPYFTTDATYMTFMIGRNYLQDFHRPYEYVVVRHAPASPNAYDFYGENLQPNFDAVPTWMYATPHNIQLKTPQNASCNACHGNADIFLTADKVTPEELNANQSVIVPEVPAAQ